MTGSISVFISSQLLKLAVRRSSHIVFFLLTTLLISTTMANEEAKAVSAGNAKFTNQLYGQLAKETGKNVFFSPISAYTALALAHQGAEGETDKAMATALNIADKKKSADGFQSVMSNLNDVANVTLEIANKLYVAKSHTMKENYKTVATKQFFAGAENIEFSKSEEAAKTINTWVEKQTKDKIKDLISADSLDQDTRMVIVNAIYFKGLWADPFKKEQTKVEKFWTSKTDSVDCDMMHRTGDYFYKEDSDLNAKVLSIPYQNKDINLIVVLPNEKDGITDLESKLANYDLTQLTKGMHKPEVIVSLPRFKIETTMNLNEPLSNIGFANIFSDAANFSGLLNSPEPLQVSKVIQKAFIEVNEEGAEAAAATGLVMMTRCMPMPKFKVPFLADHPFMFYLTKSQSVLFAGKFAQIA